MKERFKLYYKLLYQEIPIVECFDTIEEAEFALKNSVRFLGTYGEVTVHTMKITKKNIEKIWIHDELGTFNFDS